MRLRVSKGLRDVYAQKALNQIPRLLGNQDRNPFSPAYGCFHRDYWLDKTSDFSDAVRQFGVHSLALVYAYDFPGNIYKGKAKIRDWAVAGMMFWTKIQHKEGSFDEFYPYERGWVGPTAFTTFAVAEAYGILKDEMTPAERENVLRAIKKAADFIAAGEAEEDHLANHHAMASLAVWKASRLLNDDTLLRGYERLLEGYLAYHDKAEGWSREYDGIDPGYLSASVSFLGKIYQDNRSPAILDIMRRTIECCSYFVYPNGYYAGSMGSRNTLHFYPHGFEVFSNEIPLAGAVAEKMLKGLSEGKLVPPEIISDRYVFYRVPEYLQAYLDYGERPLPLPELPCEQAPFERYFNNAKIWIKKTPRHYCIANLAKGGVIKVFDSESGKLILNDCGMIGKLSTGEIVTSQWVDPSYTIASSGEGWEVSGNMNRVPSHKHFTLFKNIVFRTVLLLIGWHPGLAHLLKGKIRKMLILGNRPVPVRFKRVFRIIGEVFHLTNEIHVQTGIRFSRLSFGDEFFVRYVPQSRYFQAQELEITGYSCDGAELKTLNENGLLTKTFTVKG